MLSTNSAQPDCAKPGKLWIYTNYDCNLSCGYCLAMSTPKTPRQELGLDRVKQLIDEAVELGFDSVFFTGGEPLLLDSIYDMLAYATGRLPATLLTNGMLAKGNRLNRLVQINHPDLVIQVSLDGAQAETHDAYRGKGSWAKTLDSISLLLEKGFHLKISTTITPANEAATHEICELHNRLGIPEEDHIIRPLALRGFAQEGILVDRETLFPEITVNARGVYWHPLSTDEDMLISTQIFPLADSLKLVLEKLQGAQALQTVK